METIGNWWMWTAFATLVAGMLAVDLFVGGARAHRVTLRESAAWTAGWVAVAAAFAAGLWWYLDAIDGRGAANEVTLTFVTAYLLEKSLAIDNVFVWLTIFMYFAVPAELTRRVLVYGVLGAIAMRTVMILSGTWLISHFDWVLYVFGALLLATAAKMWWAAGKTPDLASNRLVRWVKRRIRITEGFEGERFLVVREEGGRLVRYATPLFLVLVLVEASDLVFAVDSIPAVFAITTDPFIVLTSNVFAILGLRAMYFLLADVAARFALLQYGLAIVLAFVGVKMLLVDLYKVPVWISLAAIVTVIGGSILLSLRGKRLPTPVRGGASAD